MTDFQLKGLLNSLLTVLTGNVDYGSPPTDKERILSAIDFIGRALDVSREKERFTEALLKKKLELQDNPDACKKVCDILDRIDSDGVLK